MQITDIYKFHSLEKELVAMPSIAQLDFFLTCNAYHPPTELMSEGFLMKFSNQYKREIDFIFYPDDETDVVLITIINTATGTNFFLNHWIKKHKIPITTKHLHLHKYTGSFNEKIKHYVDYLNSTLENKDLVSILAGKTWQNVPFDWAGMR